MNDLGDDDIEVDVAARQGDAAIGTVVASGARAEVLRGRQVLIGPRDACGECEVCRRGGAPVCPLGRGRAPGPRIRAAARWAIALGDGLDLPLPGGAAVAGDVALAYTLYARTGLGPREPVVVVGASPVARFLVEILRAKGLQPVVVVAPAVPGEPVDPGEAWADWLLARGAALARIAPDAAADHARAVVTAVVDETAAQATGARPWRVIAAAPDAVAAAAALAGPRATLTVLAGGDLALPAALISREVTVIGVAGPHPDLVVEAAALCVKGEVDLVAGTSLAPTPDHRAVIVAYPSTS